MTIVTIQNVSQPGPDLHPIKVHENFAFDFNESKFKTLAPCKPSRLSILCVRKSDAKMNVF